MARLLVAALLLTAVGTALPQTTLAQADPVATLAVGGEPDGSAPFGADLERLWNWMDEPTTHRLRLSRLETPEQRLDAVQRGHAHFAVVDMQSALERMPKLEQTAAITTLWPVLLHPLAMKSPQLEISLPLAQETWVFAGAEYAHKWLLRRQQQLDPKHGDLLTLAPMKLLSDGLERSRPTLLLLPAPAPAWEVSQALAQGWTLVPLASSLTRELKNTHPSVVTSLLPKGSYPGQTQVLELPAVFLVLVGRADLPESLVRKMLESLYDRQAAKALTNPLFQALDDKMNAVFARNIAYHDVSISRFKLPAPRR